MTRGGKQSVRIIEKSEELAKIERRPEEIKQKVTEELLTWQEFQEIIRRQQGDKFFILEPIEQAQKEFSGGKVHLRGAEELINQTLENIKFSSKLVDTLTQYQGLLEQEIKDLKKQISEAEPIFNDINSKAIRLENEKGILEGELGQVKYELAEIQKREQELNSALAERNEEVRQFKANPVYQHEQQVNQNLDQLRNLVETHAPSSWSPHIGWLFAILTSLGGLRQYYKQQEKKKTQENQKILDDMMKNLDHLPKKEK